MLAFYELLGNIDNVNDKLSKYEAVTAADLQRIAQGHFYPTKLLGGVLPISPSTTRRSLTYISDPNRKMPLKP